MQVWIGIAKRLSMAMFLIILLLASSLTPKASESHLVNLLAVNASKVKDILSLPSRPDRPRERQFYVSVESNHFGFETLRKDLRYGSSQRRDCHGKGSLNASKYRPDFINKYKNIRDCRLIYDEENIIGESLVLYDDLGTDQYGVFIREWIKLYRLGELIHKPSTLFQYMFPTRRGRYMSGTNAEANNEVFVSNSAELYAALESATTGTVISLAGGDYGEFYLNSHKSDVDFPEGVTITSADAQDPASFSSMFLYGASNLNFDGIVFDYSYSEGDNPNGQPFLIRESNNITISNSLFEGDIAEGLGDEYDGAGLGKGLAILDSSNITVQSSEFVNLMKGITATNTDDLVISDNEMHDLHSDGIIITEVNNVLIENNYIHDISKPEGSDAHQDMIQLFSNNREEPSTNITITGNIFDRGDGDAVQGLHFRNEAYDKGQVGESIYYQNITITDNIIMPGAKNGILVGEVNGLTIQNNTVLQPFGGSEDAEESVKPAIYVNNTTSTDVVITDNIGMSIPENDNPDYVIGNNLIVQYDDPGLPFYYDDVFVDAFAAVSNSGDYSDLAILPGSGFEGYGASVQAYDMTPQEPAGIIDAERGGDLDSLSVDFQATSLVGPDGPLDLVGATVDWMFGDGATAKGLSVNHAYSGSGSYSVEAIVSLATGDVVHLDKTIRVESPIVVELTFDDTEVTGLRAQSDMMALTVDNGVTATDSMTVGKGVTFEDGAARLNDGTISIDSTDQMKNNDAFSFVMDVKLDEVVDGTVRIASLVGAFQLKVQDGRIIAGLSVDGEGHSIYADADLSTGVWHSLALTYSNDTSRMALYLDGQQIGVVNGLSGLVSASSGHDLVLGDYTSATSFDGLVDNIAFLTGALSEEQVRDFDLNQLIGASGSTDGTDSSETTSDPVTTPPPVEDSDPETTDPTEEKDASTDPVSDENTAYNGSDSGDFLRGTRADETFHGGGGDDLIATYGGNDIAYGEAGNDILAGNSGDEQLYGGEGDDILKGQGGNDFLDGGEGADVLKGMDGDDVLVFDNNDVYIHGGSGFDTLKIAANASAISDLTNSAMTYYGIEAVDAENGAADTLIVDHKKASRSDTGVLQISGDSEDKVIFEADGVQITGEQTIDGKNYFEVETTLHSDHAQFLVDADMTILDQNNNVYAENGFMADYYML